jgi:hypothetical protein
MALFGRSRSSFLSTVADQLLQICTNQEPGLLISDRGARFVGGISTRGIGQATSSAFPTEVRRWRMDCRQGRASLSTYIAARGSTASALGACR